MNTPRVYKTEAVVLRQRRLGEADKILTLYSADQGKFDAVAKGVRRPGSRKAGHVELLTHVSLMLAHGQNLDIVTQSQAINGFLPMRDDLAKLSSGLYVAELLDRFTEERETSYPLFRLLVEALERIARGDQVSVALRYFEMGLLTISGYAPQLRACVVCGGGLRPVVNAFSPSAGGAVCADCNPAQSALRRLSVNGIKVMRLMQQAPFADVARIRLGHDLAVEIEDHLRAVLRVHAERDLRSLQFLHRIGRESNASGNAAAVVS